MARYDFDVAFRAMFEERANDVIEPNGVTTNL